MDLSLTDDQQLLQDSALRYLRNEYDLAARRRRIETAEGFSRDTWRTFADLGWLGAPFPEDQGGLGGGPVEIMVLMEAFGRGLVVEPFVPTVLLGGQLVARGAGEAVRTAVLPGVIAGETLLAFAHGEPQSRFDLFDVATTAERTGEGWVLRGTKSHVLGGHAADRFVVSARTAGARRDGEGISLFLANADAPGLTLRDYPTVDGHRAAEVSLDAVSVPADAMIGAEGAALPLIEEVVDRTIAALCAEAVGIMATLHEFTVEFLKGRSQFGVPIGKFQALQHRAVDMFVACEEARSMAVMATVKADSAPAERARAVAAAKAFIGRAGRKVGQEAIQLHGGMGMTEEMPVGHYFKRLTVLDTLFGNADHQLDRFAAAE